MSKHVRRPKRKGARPTATDCLFHRCEAHKAVKQLNASEEATGSECGACLAEEVAMLAAQQLLILDGYAARLQYSHALKEKLAQARTRLNLLSLGAGDWLDADVGTEDPNGDDGN
jgi:hypothetical protein